MAKCEKCGAKIEGNAKFCVKCGTPVPKVTTKKREKRVRKQSVPKCKKCGAALEDGAKFCVKCGAPVPKNGSKSILSIFSRSSEKKDSQASPRKTRKKHRIIITVSAVALALILIVAFVIVPLINPRATMEQLSDDYITFDQPDTTVEQIGYETLPTEITSFSPGVGTVGSAIEIKGSNIDIGSLQRVKLGTWDLPIIQVTSDTIFASVTSDITTNTDHELQVEFSDRTFDLGTFTVVEPAKESIFTGYVSDVDVYNEFHSDQVNIYIPAGALSKSDTITVYKVQESLGCPLDDGSCVYYDIRIGDQHAFNETITIEFPTASVNTGNNETPTMVTFNESTGNWDLVYAGSSVNGKLVLYTDHLSIYGWLPKWNCFHTDDRYFHIAYNYYDDMSVPGYANMTELAEAIGNQLSSVRKTYDAEFGQNALSKPIAIPYGVIVTSTYNEDGAAVNPLSGKMYLPTKYETQLSLETTVAHELLHVYQREAIGFRTMFSRLWLTEAMAEYASYKTAYALTPYVWNGTKLFQSIEKTNGTHEYSMSVFLDYLLTKYNKSFSELYSAYVTNKNDSSESALVILQNVFGLDGAELIKEYHRLWLDAYEGRYADAFPDTIQYLNSSVPVLIKANPLNKTIKASIDNPYGVIIEPLQLKVVKENVPVRYIRISAPTKSNLKVIQYDTSQPFAKGLTESIKAGGSQWIALSNEMDSNHSYATFELNDQDILLIAFLGEGDHTTYIREIDAIAQTKKFGNITNKDKVEIIYSFNGIFEECTELLVETNFGDGKTISKKLPWQQTIIMRNTYQYRKLPTKPITGSLYDITDGKKELIAQVVIPVAVDLVVELEVDKSEIYEGETAAFTVNVDDSTYNYIWDFGDDSFLEEDNQNTITHVYKEAGTYYPQVSIYDAQEKLVGTARCEIEVVKDESKQNDPILADQVTREMILSAWGYGGTYTLLSHEAVPKDDSDCAKNGMTHFALPDYQKYVGVQVDDRDNGDFLAGSTDGQITFRLPDWLGFNSGWSYIEDIDFNGSSAHKKEEDSNGSHREISMNFSLDDEGYIIVEGTMTVYDYDSQFCVYVHKEFEFHYKSVYPINS